MLSEKSEEARVLVLCGVLATVAMELFLRD